MSIQKLPEFAKDGQKNTDNLILDDGFPVNLKPARQWFNFLFNTLFASINKIIDEDYLPRREVIDNLNSSDIDKPLAAAQGVILNTKKVEIGGSYFDSFARDVDYYQDINSEQTFESFDELPSGSRALIYTGLGLINTPQWPNLEFAYVETKTTYKNNAQGKMQTAIGYTSGLIAIRCAGTYSEYGPWLYQVHSESNIASASKLQTPRKINNVDFDGSQDIQLDLGITAAAVANYDAVGSIISSNGIYSVAHLETGLYEITLSKEAPHTKYKVIALATHSGRIGAASVAMDGTFVRTKSKFRLLCKWGGDNTNGSYNPVETSVMIIY